MRRFFAVGRAGLVLAVSAALVATAPAASSPLGGLVGPVSVDPWLVGRLVDAAPAERVAVLVHGTDLPAAHAAVSRAGLTRLHDIERIGVTIASGTPPQVRLVLRQPGVTRVEGDRPLAFFLDSSHTATRGDLAMAALTDADGAALDGTGVSVAVIDTGVDPTHPFFADTGGSSAVVANLKNVCAIVQTDPERCFPDLGPRVDTDTTSAGGHGTHVNGIVAGRPTTLTDGTRLHGAAPGAKLVSLSVGAGPTIINAALALKWVLDHHAAPCGDDVPAIECPPVKVINNSYGPLGGGDFDPDAATAKLQRALADEGVVTVWANGNSEGSGEDNRSNPPGQDPTPGIVSVASYFDRNTGTRDGAVSSFSSRGKQGKPETWPDVSAPGEKIVSSCRPYLTLCSGDSPRNGPAENDSATFDTLSGTSMAAPHIAGIVAQLFQARPDATPGEIEHALKASAYKYTHGAEYQQVGDYTSSVDKGTGLVDVVAAVQVLRENMLVNGSFENTADGVAPDGWTGGAGTGYDTSGDHASDGVAAVSITGLGTAGAGTWRSQETPVTEGERYGGGVAATITDAAGAPQPRMVVEFLDQAGSVVAAPSLAVAGVGQLLGMVTAPTGAVQARVVLSGFAADDPSPRGTVWFDAVWFG